MVTEDPDELERQLATRVERLLELEARPRLRRIAVVGGVASGLIVAGFFALFYAIANITRISNTPLDYLLTARISWLRRGSLNA